MVNKVGNRGYTYTVELVEASTKFPFPEHTSPDGATTIAEVEPEAEYLVKVDVRDGAGQVPKIMADLKVDGKRLRTGVMIWKIPAGQIYLGFRSVYDGIKTISALKFSKVGVSNGLGADLAAEAAAAFGGERPSQSIGTVNIHFYEAIKKKKKSKQKQQGNFKYSKEQEWAGEAVVAATKDIGKKKTLQSKSGETILSVKEVTGGSSDYRHGVFIDDIELKYGSAQTLISAGIFPSSGPTQQAGEVIDLTENTESKQDDAKRSAEGQEGDSDNTKKKAKREKGGDGRGDIVDLTFD